MLTAVVAVGLAAILVGYTGFGFNLVAVPLLALVMGPKEAVVIGLVVGSIVNAAVAIGSRRDQIAAILGRLVLGAVPGLVVGVAIFAAVNDSILKVLIGLLTIGFAVFLYRRPQPIVVSFPRRQVMGIGAASGVLTATTGMGGPPVIALLTHSTPIARQVRSTGAAFTAVMSVAALATLGFTGVMARDLSSVESTLYLGLKLGPVGLAGMWIGSWVFRAYSTSYARVLAVTLFVLGVTGVALATSALIN